MDTMRAAQPLLEVFTAGPALEGMEAAFSYPTCSLEFIADSGTRLVSPDLPGSPLYSPIFQPVLLESKRKHMLPRKSMLRADRAVRSFHTRKLSPHKE